MLICFGIPVILITIAEVSLVILCNQDVHRPLIMEQVEALKV